MQSHTTPFYLLLEKVPRKARNKGPCGELNPRLLSVEPRVLRTDALPIIQATHGSTDKSRGFNSPFVTLFRDLAGHLLEEKISGSSVTLHWAL